MRKKMSMNNEPVAIRYDFDGYGYQYMDSGSGSDWLTRVDGELLYTQPNEHDLGIAEAIGFDKGYKAATAKTLTDEEIWEVINRTAWVGTEEEIRFKIADAILREAQSNCNGFCGVQECKENQANCKRLKK